MGSYGRITVSLFAVFAGILGSSGTGYAQCPDEPALVNSQGGGMVTCPCFVAGEEAGAVFQAPAADYPIEIVRIGIGWGSQFGGAPATLEEQITVRAGGLPVPGAILGTLPAPQMTDGFVNEFDLTNLPGVMPIPVASGPFTVTLEFFNPNALMLTAPSMVHDGNGCMPGRNVVFAVPGGWFDACALGVTGDWQVQVVYRRTNCMPTDPQFIRGECNSDGQFNIADAVTLLSFLFPSGPGVTLLCLDACDANDDGQLNIADAIAVLAALFGSPTNPLPPPSTCDVDPTLDAVACAMSACP
ncbi:MAG: hypothetical protein AB7O52_06000 [Planctomycetota bacterium]